MRCGPALHVNRAGLDAVLGQRHRRIDVQQRDARAVHRDFDLLALALFCPNSGPLGDIVEAQPENVIAVGGKIVNDRKPAARAERRAVHVAHLRGHARNAVSGGERLRAGIAHRLAADAAGGADVAFHQRRRNGEHVGHIVEAVAHVVGRQERRNVHREIQQIADGVGVFGAIQAVQRGPAGVRTDCRRAIDTRFERGGERFHRRRARPRHSGRRHQAGAELANHFFGEFGGLIGVSQIEPGQGHAAGLQRIVMTAAAILLNQGAPGNQRRRRSGSLAPGRCSRRQGGADKNESLHPGSGPSPENAHLTAGSI